MVHRNFGEKRLDFAKMNGIRQATEAEMDARRERTDKISKLMGQYLLKGYKMLATCCDRCSNILLEDRQGQTYCVACEEVDKVAPATVTRPNDPALAIEREGGQESFEIPLEDTEQLYYTVPKKAHIAARKQLIDNSKTQNPASSCATPIKTSLYANADATTVIQAKMEWATNELRHEIEPKRCQDLVYLIKACAETVETLTK